IYHYIMTRRNELEGSTGGLAVTQVTMGINLDPDKVCNFYCAYCQADGRFPPEHRKVDPSVCSRSRRIAAVQVYTAARTPSEDQVGPLDFEELKRVGTIIRERVGVPVDVIPVGPLGG